MSAPGRITDQGALRAYHLDRVTGKFKTVISAENAELLTRLLGGDEGAVDGAA